ncbi:GNAT family N-acetyltransferase [Ectothiorhodospira sp. BSL-9]|uniref:GNAT family N-acetyltransferase n=1 Tax=Ectothiorhodospira sp. BSL-9 TaxID=1442136 RepID=UPI0007B4491D|nr:GNAT family N-acetyltransferase [Ectothiorhodospira sp. BSL-9]ANB03192.1 hypothetical protein ECTOBSL9_2784 [Ectothiorhodospira sp. BSL-9]
MEKFAYLIKHRFPFLFCGIGALARAITSLRFRRVRRQALAYARMIGTVAESPAELRPLEDVDVGLLTNFIAGMPAEHLQFFHPHGFESREVERVIRSRAFMSYGLFVDGDLRAYGLLKLAPTGSAFIGMLVDPKLQGRGLGRFLVHYLYWQASLAGFRTRSSISEHNVASVRAHKAVADYRVLASLPNDYSMIEFVTRQVQPPVLQN